MEFQYLKNILEDLKSRFELKHSPSDLSLRRQLQVLNRMEAQLIRKKVLELEYNNSLAALKILQETDILKITDYLENTNDEGVVQGIIADIFDTPNSEQVLADVIANLSEAIAVQFNVCFKQYVSDVIQRPEVVKNEFICGLGRHLPNELFRDKIVLSFLKELLNNHRDIEITGVISEQKSWNMQFNQKPLLSLITEFILARHSAFVFTEIILKHLKSDARINWYYLLFMIKHIQPFKEITEGLKKFLKRSLKIFHETGDEHHLYVTLIIARQLFHYQASSEILYKTWLKSTIGEMHYHLKDSNKFIRAVECLAGMIFYEFDVEVLETHSQTAISSMRGTNHLILEYKQQLRTRIAALTEPTVIMDLT